MGGLFLGVRGFAAFWAVLVVLPVGPGRFLLLLVGTNNVPLAGLGWVLVLVLSSSLLVVFPLPSILAG